MKLTKNSTANVTPFLQANSRWKWLFPETCLLTPCTQLRTPNTVGAKIQYLSDAVSKPPFTYKSSVLVWLLTTRCSGRKRELKRVSQWQCVVPSYSGTLLEMSPFGCINLQMKTFGSVPVHAAFQSQHLESILGTTYREGAQRAKKWNSQCTYCTSVLSLSTDVFVCICVCALWYLGRGSTCFSWTLATHLILSTVMDK